MHIVNITIESAEELSKTDFMSILKVVVKLKEITFTVSKSELEVSLREDVKDEEKEKHLSLTTCSC